MHRLLGRSRRRVEVHGGASAREHRRELAAQLGRDLVEPGDGALGGDGRDVLARDRHRLGVLAVVHEQVDRRCRVERRQCGRRPPPPAGTAILGHGRGDDLGRCRRQAPLPSLLDHQHRALAECLECGRVADRELFSQDRGEIRQDRQRLDQLAAAEHSGHQRSEGSRFCRVAGGGCEGDPGGPAAQLGAGPRRSGGVRPDGQEELLGFSRREGQLGRIDVAHDSGRRSADEARRARAAADDDRALGREQWHRLGQQRVALLSEGVTVVVDDEHRRIVQQLDEVAGQLEQVGACRRRRGAERCGRQGD